MGNLVNFQTVAVPSPRVSPTRKINGISRSQLWLLFEAGRSNEGAEGAQGKSSRDVAGLLNLRGRALERGGIIM